MVDICQAHHWGRGPKFINEYKKQYLHWAWTIRENSLRSYLWKVWWRKRKLRYPKEFRTGSPCKGKSNDVTIVHACNGPRELTLLGMPLSKAFKDLSSKGIMKPLDLGRHTPNISSPTYFANEYCEYLQSKGHHMDKFSCLRHDIEDLIESKKITKPHIGKNSLLECHVVPPPTWGWLIKNLVFVISIQKCPYYFNSSMSFN